MNAGVGTTTDHAQHTAASADTAAKAASEAATKAGEATTAATETKSELAEVLKQVTVGDPTTQLHYWEQVPAWILWIASLGLGFYMVSEKYNTSAGWTFLSIALFVGVILSYRTKFSWGGEKPEAKDSSGKAGAAKAGAAKGGAAHGGPAKGAAAKDPKPKEHEE